MQRAKTFINTRENRSTMYPNRYSSKYCRSQSNPRELLKAKLTTDPSKKITNTESGKIIIANKKLC